MPDHHTGRNRSFLALMCVAGAFLFGLALLVGHLLRQDAPAHVLGLIKQLDWIDRFASPAGAALEHRVTVRTLRSIAARIRFLTSQAAELDVELINLVPRHPAGGALLAQPGVGPVVAALLLVCWSHLGRVRNEAAFASLAGVAPLEASSGQRTRHRLPERRRAGMGTSGHRQG